MTTKVVDKTLSSNYPKQMQTMKDEYTKTTHVIFDLDGTLINTPDIAVDVITQYAKSQGRELYLDIQKKFPYINDARGLINDILDILSIPNEKRENIIKQILKTYLNQKIDLIPGVEKLVKHLYKHNIPMAVATNTSKEHFTKFSQQFPGFFSKYFSHVVFALDDPEVKNSKPNPDIYYVCADRFKSKPENIKNILVVEDSLKGISGAVASGMKTLLINDRKLCDFKGICNKITKICDTFDDFEPESVGLPSYD